jgi:hypothetical protein
VKFVWDNGEWYQGEKPKKVTYMEWLQDGGYIILVVGLIIVGVWWWFSGSEWVFSDLSHKLTPPKHLWR